MRPLEAYETVMRFAAERGEPALRLALHAAVPQSFRPGFLHLLRLNFVGEAPHEAEADVLLAPFCEDTGGGYYQFDPVARRLLLDQLDPAYPGEKVSRVQRVADFLVTYIESERGRLSADQDRLAEDYLAIQGWVALAFLRPETAAMQLAAALDQGTQGEVAARVQFSGLASALSVPLVQYPKLLTYAAGIEAMEQGRTDDAAGLLERLPDEEIRIGSVTLRSPRKLLARRDVPRGDKEPRVEKEAASKYGSCFISYLHEDDAFVVWLSSMLRSRGVHIWTAVDDIALGQSVQERIQERTAEGIQSSDTFLLVLSKKFRFSDYIDYEVNFAQRTGRLIISLMIDPPEEVLGSDVPATTAIDFSRPENREKSLGTLLELLKANAGLASRAASVVEEEVPPEVVAEPEPFEARFVEDASYSRLSDDAIMLARSRAVASLGYSVYQGDGTGFLFDGSLISPQLADKRLLLTCAHVCPEAIPPQDIRVGFLGAGGNRQRNIVIEHPDLLWYSPSSKLDAALLLLEVAPYGVEGPPIAFPWSVQVGDVACIIGHLWESTNLVSLKDNQVREVDSARFRYTSATDPGSSGSPVFDQNWNLIGLHHAGNSSTKLNEAIRIDRILDELKEWAKMAG